MRRVHVLLASSSLLLTALVGVAACSSASQASHAIGPVFETGTGTDAAMDHLPDVFIPFDTGAHPPADGGAHDASGHDADATTKPDGAGGHDATALDSTSGPDAEDAAGDATGTPDVTSTLDASVCPSGTGTVALVGGTSTLAFGAYSTNGAAWKLTSFAGQSVTSTPAVVPYGLGFLAAFTSASTADLESTLFTSGGAPSWSAPATLPTSGGVPATGIGAPGLALLGANAELVYQGSDNKFYHGAYSASTWGQASDPVGGAAAAQDYGPSAPSVASVGSTLYVAYDGGDGGLYVDSWTSSGGWAGAVPVGGAGTGGVPPTLIALTGGSADMLLVFEVPSTNLLYSSFHTAGGGAGTWSAPVIVDATANTATAASVAPLAGGGAVMVYLGTTDAFPYASTYSPTASTPWTTPVKIYPNSLPLSSPPTVAAGTCGVDAVAAITQTVGAEILTLKGGTWSAPVLVGGTASMKYATVATSP
jgi:hypothetical protein